MKKKLITSVTLSTLLSASAIFAGGPEIIVQPDYFSGFYIGGTGAFHHVSLDASSSVNNPQDITISQEAPLFAGQVIIPAGLLTWNDSSGSSYAGYGGVQGGFGKVFSHQWYVGVQGFGEWGSASNTANDINSTAPNSTVTILTPQDLVIEHVATTSQENSNSTTVKISNNYGVAAKLGYLVTPTTLFYGKIGAVWADITTSNSASLVAHRSVDSAIERPAGTAIRLSDTTANLEGSSSNKQTKNALLLGIGAEQFVYGDMISLNVEYDYANYGSVSTSSNLAGVLTTNQSIDIPLENPWEFSGSSSGTTGATSSATGNAKVSTLLAGVNFYFGRNWF